MPRRTFAVIGLGRFGAAIATTLTELGQDVIGIDADEEKVRALADVIHQAVELDATDERALRAAGVPEVDVAVVSIGENIEASLLVVMLVKELGVETIYAKGVTPLHGRILTRLGVTRVIFPEREMAVRIAHSVVVPNVIDYVELSRDFSIVELPAPADWTGRSLKDLQLRARFGLTLIAIRRQSGTSDGEITSVAPPAEEIIQSGDILALIGSNDRLSQLDRLMTKRR
jgi:trk system potassium uptake protein TrkA